VPHFAEQQGDLVTPWEVNESDPAYCPFCGGMMGLREAHYNQGKRVKMHFFHRRGGDCGGESDIHRRMKAIARYHLQSLFGHAEVDTEVKIGDCYADVVAMLPWPLKPFGRGLAVEVQHKHKEKDIGRVSHEYLDAGYSVFWAYQSDFDEDEKTMRIVPKRARTVWPDALPDREGIEGYPDVIQKLWSGELATEGFPPIRIPEEYWRVHAIEVASPRHGRYQTDWDLLWDTPLLYTSECKPKVTLNRAPNGDLYLELWTDPHGSGSASHLPVRVGPGDVETLRQFIDQARDVAADAPECSVGDPRVLIGGRLAGTSHTWPWIALVDDSDGSLVLQLGRADHKGNERTLEKEFHEGDLDQLDDLHHQLTQRFDLRGTEVQ